jgi:tetratricopeptide (TPR) repeat protein/predicted Ser/Thr protein kinase
MREATAAADAAKRARTDYTVAAVNGDHESLHARLEARGSSSLTPESLDGERMRREVRARLLGEAALPVRIGRYVVTGKLGQGGMGVVYAARDEELGRELAIKLVRRREGPGGDHAQRRLAHEARALASLSHPHVVAIYDVGRHDDQIYIAMERIRGQTLRARVDDDALRWDEIFALYRQAGEGLAAAHRVGIVHRDFKPDNAMVGDDGRVRVLDFGLARTDPQASGDARSTMAGKNAGSSLGSGDGSVTGAAAGTPMYMAPEQRAGHDADARSDQYSFCVALWEALHGALPTRSGPRDAAREPSPAKPDASGAPRHVLVALQRGLADDPRERWPSMRSLLDACRGKRSLRRPATVALLCGAAVVAIGVVAIDRIDAGRRDACLRDATRAATWWSPDRARTVWAALVDTGLEYARSTADAATARLDAHHHEWIDARARTCIARIAEPEAAALRARQACLDDSLAQHGALADALADPNPETLHLALAAVQRLDSPRRCEDDAMVAARWPTVSERALQADVAELRRTIARAHELVAAGNGDAARELAGAAVVDASELAEPALEADAMLALGSAEQLRQDFAAAEVALERAYFLGETAADDAIALRAAIALVDVVGVGLARADDGLSWARHAEGLLARNEGARRWYEADLASHRAEVLRARGDDAGALPELRRVIDLRVAEAGPEHPAVATAWLGLGNVQLALGDLEAASRSYVEAERIAAGGGPFGAHAMGSIAISRSAIAQARGDYVGALEQSRRVLASREHVYGTDHLLVARAANNVAAGLIAIEDLDGARPLLERAIAIRRERLGPQHPQLASTLNNLGVLEHHAANFDRAEALFAEALQIRRSVLPSDHIDIATSLINLGDLHLAARRPDRARPPYVEAVEITRTHEGGKAVEHGRALVGLGSASLETGDPEAARVAIERALETAIVLEGDPAVRCHARHTLARAVAAIDDDVEAVRRIAAAAHPDCVAAGGRAAVALPDIAAWTRAPSRPSPSRASPSRPSPSGPSAIRAPQPKPG